MQIVDLELYSMDEPASRSWRWRDGLPGSPERNQHCWLRVMTDGGVDGWALGGSPRIMQDLVGRRLRDLAVGQDPLMREALFERLWEVDRVEEFPIYATGLLDIALWDIAGKVAGLPVYKLIGGFRDRIPAYASTVTYDTVDDYLKRADAALAANYRAIKLHAWGDVRRDAALAVALRKHVGPDIDLMYDGSAAFRYEEALRLGRVLEEEGYLWYEEPMREFAVPQYRRLTERLDIPVLAAETSDGAHWTAASFEAFGACDILRTGSDFKGGLTGALRIAHLADAHGMYAEVHGDGLPNLHLACSIPNTRYLEVLVFDDPFAENESYGELALDADGCVNVPSRPGIGWQIDVDDLARRAASVS